MKSKEIMEEIFSANRIMVIGHPGAGKSTLTIELARLLNLPIVHLDREYWQPGWVELPDKEWRERVTALVNRERWIMDGSYDSTLEIRLPRAELVILLDYRRLLSMWRVIKRMLLNLGKVRPDMADDCPEKIDAVFLKFVWKYHRDRMPKVKERIARYLINGSLIRFDSPTQTKQFVKRSRLMKIDL